MADLSHMSHFALIALGQLERRYVFDGDLVTKRGRDDLMAAGLAERVPMYGCPGVMKNQLTKAGATVAARLQDEGNA